MQQLIRLIVRLRFVIVFVFLEVICSLLIINNNNYQRTAFLSSSSYIVGFISGTKNRITRYLSLNQVNQELLDENKLLRTQLQLIKHKAPMLDSGLMANQRFEFISARVIRNSVHLHNNFITIDKGRKDGIEPGMAVITANGIVGDVKVCSDNYATLFSFLHSKSNVSSEIKRTGEFCSSEWHGQDYHTGYVTNLPAQKKSRIKKGDTITVSQANAIYPPNIPIGIVKHIDEEEASNFYTIEMTLTTQFSNLNYVYVVKNRAKNTIDSLEQVLIDNQ